MKMSRRARRMDRHHRRHRGVAFNMISLMDIFTILVFFLLVNSADVQIQPSKAVVLPESLADQKPRETTVVTITGSDVLVQGELVASVEDIRSAPGQSIRPLVAELQRLANLRLAELPPEQREITIVGDRQTPFNVLKTVMASCTEAGFARISLTVVQRSTAAES